MGINSESDMAANLQIGPTTLGMVRIYVEGDGIDLPLDFDPDEALETIAARSGQSATPLLVHPRRSVSSGVSTTCSVGNLDWCSNAPMSTNPRAKRGSPAPR